MNLKTFLRVDGFILIHTTNPKAPFQQKKWSNGILHSILNLLIFDRLIVFLGISLGFFSKLQWLSVLMKINMPRFRLVRSLKTATLPLRLFPQISIQWYVWFLNHESSSKWLGWAKKRRLLCRATDSVLQLLRSIRLLWSSFFLYYPNYLDLLPNYSSQFHIIIIIWQLCSSCLF